MRPTRPVQVESLYREIRSVLEQARASAYRTVNVAMIHAYWHVGRLIVVHEQGGRRRAGYGERVLQDLSQRLTNDFGRGFDVRNLRYMRQFYVAYPTPFLGDEAGAPRKRNALRSELERVTKRNALRSEFGIHHATRDQSRHRPEERGEDPGDQAAAPLAPKQPRPLSGLYYRRSRQRRHILLGTPRHARRPGLSRQMGAEAGRVSCRRHDTA